MEPITTRFTPWPHQSRLLQHRADGARWLLAIWHRRGGKDLTAYNGLWASAAQRVGTYYHVFPEAAQGRKVWWKEKDNLGQRLIDYMPKALQAGVNETEMRIELTNGSAYQVVGADHMGWLGGNVVGAIMSEYPYQDPLAWQLMTPILLANGGWAWFVYTPLGHNHGWALYKNVQHSPEWVVDVQTIRDTQKADGTPIVTEAMIAFERTQGKKEALIEQEYYCSFEGNLEGAVYGELLKAMRRDGRVGPIAHERHLPVLTAWDLGMGDANAIGFFQRVGREHRLIDYHESTGKGFDYYADLLKSKRREHGYSYETVEGNILCEGPHDLKVREYGTGGKTRVESARKAGLHMRVGKKLLVEEGIGAVRALLPNLWINAQTCGRALDAMSAYRYEWDEVRQCYGDKPAHDWTSHPMDMLRYYAVAAREDPSYTPATKALTAFDVWSDETAEFEFNPFSVEV